MNVLVTGGSGFIGSHFIEELLLREEVKVVINIDSLTYAANSKLSFWENKKYIFYNLDINSDLLGFIFKMHQITHVIHFAAESHVDNSIKSSLPFIRSNINGTHNLLELALRSGIIQKFIHVSTDEVFGSLNYKESAFTVDTPYRPNSPYASSKAASDLIVRSFNKTYNLPTIITNCSNNFGPRQNKEKMIPKCISNFKSGTPIPLYGNGLNIRDWIFVKDHVSALINVLFNGQIGKQYLIGGENEISNFDLIHILAEEYKNITGSNLNDNWFEYVEDRKGHDLRYAIDLSDFLLDFPDWKISNFKKSIRDTIISYI